MTAHVFNSRLDPRWPATLSPATLQRLLRGELGYQGVVITDDMQMGAIRDNYGFEEAIEQAIIAGADIIAIANNTVFEADAVVRAFEAIHTAVRARRIEQSRIDESYERIMRLKSRIG
jgi:beta-N-acetylhexosaminidase